LRKNDYGDSNLMSDFHHIALNPPKLRLFFIAPDLLTKALDTLAVVEVGTTFCWLLKKLRNPSPPQKLFLSCRVAACLITYPLSANVGTAAAFIAPCTPAKPKVRL
jgi:hypothetical protein